MTEQKLVNNLKRQVRLLDVRCDIVFKRIFGQHPNLTKSFLNSILPLPDGHLIDTISYLSPEQSPRIPSMKNTIVDVKCTDQQGRIFIVEMQLAWTSSFTKRFLFGASKAFVQQLDSGQAYETLCPVYGLAILNELFEKTTPEWYHHYRLINVKDLDKCLEGLELIFVELKKFKPQTFLHRKMGTLWLRFLREINENLLSIPQEFQNDPDLAMAIELAKESSYSKEELELYDQHLDAIRVEQTVRADSFVEGEQIGLEKGRVEGRVEGEQIGADNRAHEIAKELILGGMVLDKVAKFTKLSKERVQKLAESVAGKAKD